MLLYPGRHFFGRIEKEGLGEEALYGRADGGIVGAGQQLMPDVADGGEHLTYVLGQGCGVDLAGLYADRQGLGYLLHHLNAVFGQGALVEMGIYSEYAPCDGDDGRFMFHHKVDGMLNDACDVFLVEHHGAGGMAGHSYMLHALTVEEIYYLLEAILQLGSAQGSVRMVSRIGKIDKVGCGLLAEQLVEAEASYTEVVDAYFHLRDR
jgi:hypothetical protein